MTLEADVQQGWHSAIVEMIDLDLSPITGDAQDVFYFTNQIKPDDTKIQWQGNTYEPIPIIAAGYEKSTTGQIAQPTLMVANVLGTFSQVINPLDDLVGAKVTRRRTLGKYLDGEPEADPLQEFPIDVFFVERKVQETSMLITWQLSSVLDLEGLKLPRRIITQNYCQWKYRSSECSYTGGILYGGDDRHIDTTGLSAPGAAVINSGKLAETRKKQQLDALDVRNAAINTKNQQCETFVLLETRYNSSTDYVGEGVAEWDGVIVTLGEVYRQGIQRSSTNTKYSTTKLYEIQRWGIDPTACSIATAALATANANLVTAENNLTAAQSAYTAAMTALPADDSLRPLDVCGKRLNSCKLRFPYSPLPFGGFPGANTIRR
jgi:lambda family phage minor tail protein L